MELIAFKSILAISIFTLGLVIAMYSTYFERKVAAFMQDRIGPNRAGPFGLLQPLADGGKMFFKEEFIPKEANTFLFTFAPGLAMLTACMTSAVIPWAPDLTIGNLVYKFQIADLNIGILYILAILSVSVYGIMLGGWASNNKYSLLSAIRASSQMISYELAMGLSIITIVMMSGSVSLRDITAQQSGSLFGISFLQGLNWNIFYQPLGFLIFMTCALAECNRAPFDMAECESELIGGYHTEFSSMKLGFFLFAEYINMFISSTIISVLFFGGYNFPGMHLISNPMLLTALGFVALMIKALFFIFVFMWIRWTLPRFRYDQLMQLGWKKLIPLALGNMLITAFVLLVKQ
ncbi:MAG: NADH-quinone oxidoreductase subunit NuoH [Chitinophagales bacterium]|jgi:NADH-quinone oxidoreductase subunit H|nr:NADH-quinone oxidoreductase subunit NuoH [Chitinophagales bacterium]